MIVALTRVRACASVAPRRRSTGHQRALCCTAALGWLLAPLLANARTAPALPAAGSPATASPGDDGAPVLSARAVLALQVSSGAVLLARRIHEQRSIASLTKVAATLVIRRHGLRPQAGTVIDRADW
ncbi:MAG: hypothetical protein IPG96_19500 [Proteobacteria bacterium]|nr:hypothetical protein [Pseudomonadota bacterium]